MNEQILGEYMNKQANENNQQVTVGLAQYDALRIEYEDRIDTLRKEMQSDKEKAIKRWQKALTCVSVTLMIFLVGLFGSVLYVLTNYDFATYEYEYMQDSEGINNVNSGEQGDLSYEPMVEDK